MRNILNITYFIQQNNTAQMDPQQNTADSFKQMYRSGIKASYFGHMKGSESIEKSKIQIQKIEQQKQKDVDEKTFRLMPNFKRPQSTFQVHGKSGECYIEKSSFFSCLAHRPLHLIELNNSRLAISMKGRIVRFVDFSAVWAQVSERGSHFVISFQNCEKQIFIEPTSKDEVGKWVGKLKEVIDSTQGKSKKFTYLARKSSDFYKYQHILNEQFQKQASSGDILLFKSPHSAASAQRLFTNSEYDHVGVILRNRKNQLFVYESTSTEGVGFTPWDQMVRYGWYESTNKIVWRKLNAELSQKELSTIEAFVAKTLGKGFEISLDKLFQFKSTLNRTDELEQNKTYFCSELVARLYKELGFFDSEKSSTNYYPVDFSDKVKLKFSRPGVSLSNEIIICFDK